MRRTILGNFEHGATAQADAERLSTAFLHSVSCQTPVVLLLGILVWYHPHSAKKNFNEERNPVQRNSSTVDQCQLGGGGGVPVVVKGMTEWVNQILQGCYGWAQQGDRRDPKTSITSSSWETPSRTTRAGVRSLPDRTGTVIGFPTK